MKNFTIPEFSNWYEYGKRWTQSIGEYTCTIGVIPTNLENKKPQTNEYEIRIIVGNNPFCETTKKIYEDYITCNDNDIKTLKDWYTRTTWDAKYRFKKYILEHYY